MKRDRVANIPASIRKVAIPTARPAGLTEAFSAIPEKQTQWHAFVMQRVSPELHQLALNDVVDLNALFLLPILSALGSGIPFDARWTPGGPWQRGDDAQTHRDAESSL